MLACIKGYEKIEESESMRVDESKEKSKNNDVEDETYSTRAKIVKHLLKAKIIFHFFFGIMNVLKSKIICNFFLRILRL